jgi:lysozyme
VDFCFNLGAGRLASSTLLKVLNGGRYEEAAEQLLRWDLAGGVENAGLKARREAELALWNGAEEQKVAA